MKKYDLATYNLLETGPKFNHHSIEAKTLLILLDKGSR